METKESDLEVLEQLKTSAYKLIVYNDDINSFDHVIDCLIAVCNHDQHQAEQCTYLIHYKGKCVVKVGSIEKLAAMKDALEIQNLSVEIN